MKKIFVFFVIIVFSNSALGEFPDSCPQMTIPNNCDFYTKCLEAQNQCGSSGYPLGYGNKYCHVFNNLELSSEGEEWITGTMSCLQDELIDFAENKTDCSHIKEKGFDSHVMCYVSNGFCELSLEDKYEIFKTTAWGLVTSLAGLSQAADTMLECLNEGG